jgi:hypothetical protein
VWGGTWRGGGCVSAWGREEGGGVRGGCVANKAKLRVSKVAVKFD